MISLLKKLWKDTSGNILVMAAAAMPVVIGSAGLATDTIQWVLIKRQLQRAADSAAIAGAFERHNLDEIYTPEWVEEAVLQDLKVNQNTGLDLVAGYPIIDSDDGAAVVDPGATSNTNDDLVAEDVVSVELAVRKALPFSSLFLSEAPLIKVSAKAASLPGNDDYCVVALGMIEAAGVAVTGSGALTLENCGIMTNSNNTEGALYASGAGRITATVVAAKGQISQSARIIGAAYNPYTSYFEDPFAGVEPIRSDMHCADVILTGSSDDADSSRGLDRSIVDPDNDPATPEINCFSGINVGSGDVLQLDDGTPDAPKTYYVNGSNLSQDRAVYIQGSISCSNCTIVLTNLDPDSTDIGTFDSTAQANIQINAPTGESAQYRFIAIMQDRGAVSDDGSIPNAPNKIAGGASTGIQGVVYFPSQTITYIGNSNTTAEQCTKIMGRRVGFTGNNATNIDAEVCEGLYEGMDWSSGRVIRLIA